MSILSIFRRELVERVTHCPYCGKPYTVDNPMHLCHWQSNSKINRKIVGELIDMPILNVIDGCCECNTINYKSANEHPKKFSKVLWQAVDVAIEESRISERLDGFLFREFFAPFIGFNEFKIKTVIRLREKFAKYLRDKKDRRI